MQTELHGPFRHWGGHCWTIEVDADQFPETDDPNDPSRSCLVLCENAVELGPPHTSHQEIALQGAGRYSHWNGILHFSAADNSDPNANSSRYSIRWDVGLYFRRRAAYALSIVESWASHIPGGIECFRGQDVCEIGPGRDLGTVLILAALGARVMAVDRFFGGWKPDWHDRFLPAMISGLTEAGWPVELTPLRGALAAASFNVEQINVLTQTLEDLGEEFADRADITVSQSTFEHFYSVERAASALHRISRKKSPGGNSLGVHHVDFRDHRNFGEPFEFLLLDDATYADATTNEEFRRGNRMRPGAMTQALRNAGFSHVEFVPTAKVDPSYLTAFLPRLRSATSSRFRTLDERELEVLAGVFLLRT